MADETLYGIRLRERQRRILEYEGGRMGISAVPGSGKTLTLALLAARLILEGKIGADGEVLVVTVQNAAVQNISQRIRSLLRQEGLPPVGFRVCTLHKLANDILRERLDLAGIEQAYAIIDESEARRLMHQAAEAWILRNRSLWESFLADEYLDQGSKTVDYWRTETERLGREVVKLCKHQRLTAEEAARLLGEEVQGVADQFARIGLALYDQYQRYLTTRGGLDFDDLIWRAIDALGQDASFLANLRARWCYILEDECQDSSPLQEQILEQLCGADGNWVRVGDPNQAINATFTAADPRYFRRYLRQPEVEDLSLLASGRCSHRIMHLANALVRWGCYEHPEPEIRRRAFQEQAMEGTSPQDAQQNPPDEESHVHVPPDPFDDVDTQTQEVANWVASYVERYPERSVAVLCPATWQGGKLLEYLQRDHADTPFDDLLRSTPHTRDVARLLYRALDYLADPTISRRLASLYEELTGQNVLEALENEALMRQRMAMLRSLPVDELLFPRAVAHVRELVPPGVSVGDQDLSTLERLAELVSRWVRAIHLPVDQLVLTIAQDLYGARSEQEDVESLAVAHTLAESLHGTAQMHPNWRLRDFAAELSEIARNRRTFQSFSLREAGYASRPGRAVVTTMHRAKGLEWDAVYLICVDSLEFPSLQEDTFRDEPYYMPERAPALEARKRLEQLAGTDFAPDKQRSLVAEGRLETIAERLRLLYVAITRAERDLAITWARRNGSREVAEAQAVPVLRVALAEYEKGKAT